MSAEFMPLVPTAMLGTDREAASPLIWPGEVGQLTAQLLQAQVSDDGAATRVLRVAAVLASCSIAGAHGAEWTDPLPDAARDETLAAADDGSLPALLAWALQHSSAHLHFEVCLLLARAGRRLPEALLPEALELGRRSTHLRLALASVIGERGVWLATQREDWSFAAGVSVEADIETRWSDGSFEQRIALLHEERASAPDAMRARLAASMDEMSAKERAAFAALLIERISMNDEPLLERLRADRSRDVRQAALDLLLRLPDAAHVQRAITRMAPLLQQERALLRKRWVIDAPAAPGADWKDANLDTPRPKNDSLGERAWWLYQLVRQVPLTWWTRHVGMTAVELLEWAGKTDWSEALWRGWRDVLFAAPDAEWCDAFLDHWPAPLPARDRDTVLGLLPAASRERHWLTRLRDDRESVAAVVSQAIAVCAAGESLSLAMSTAFADGLSERVSRGQIDDYTLRPALTALAATLHPDLLDRIADWPRSGSETPAFLDVMHDVTQIIAVRRALRTLTTPRRS